MKIIIPYKENSERCHNKNTKEFYNGQSILDLTIDQFDGHEVYLASIPSDTTCRRASSRGVKTIALEGEDLGWSPMIYDISQKIKNITDPVEPVCFWLFTEITYFINNGIEDFLHHGTVSLESGDHDSTVVVRQFKHFLFDEYFKPHNFNPGCWHPYSQGLPPRYIVGHGGVTTQKLMETCRYTYGPRVKAYIAKEPYVDIDTEEEFAMAGMLWEHHDK